jgi:hypothetical protein
LQLWRTATHNVSLPHLSTSKGNADEGMGSFVQQPTQEFLQLHRKAMNEWFQ